MLLVGLTGGIGSGKSTVARMLADRGAVVFDADDFARAALEPGTPGNEQVTAAFPIAITPDGEVDRAKLASLVFDDQDARAQLESILHPAVLQKSQEALAPYADTDKVVVYAMPLLVETHAADRFDMTVVVLAEEDLRLERLLNDRGLSEADARARMTAQATDEERGTVADVIIDNDEGLEELEHQVDGLWQTLSERASRT